MGTETVAVLFSDLVGAEQLRGRLGEDAAARLLTACDRRLRDVVTSHGGTVVKAVADGHMATFPAVGSATAAAVDLQQMVARWRLEQGIRQPAGLRAGLAAGDVTVEEGDCFGMPVVVAARLCESAAQGQVLVADVVRQLSHGGPYGFEPAGEHQLKGLRQPLGVWELLWEAPAAGAIPLPPWLGWPGPLLFVGREAELAALEDARKAATAGEGPRLVAVGGEAGIGKTALVREASRRAHERGSLVLYGRCDEVLAAPYQPFTEAVRNYLAHAPDEDLAGTRHSAALARLLSRPDPSEAPRQQAPATDPDTERVQLFAAFAALIRRASSSQPLLLILEDLHWADRDSVQLFRYLAQEPALTRVLMIGTYRSSMLSPGHSFTQLLSLLRSGPAATRVDLEGWDEDHIAAFVEAAAGSALGEAGRELASTLARDTGGNPFFVGELFRHWRDTAGLSRDGSGAWRPAAAAERAGLPDSVREVLSARIGKLGEQAHGALATASVLGELFDLELLASVLEREEEPLLAVLEQAVKAGLLREDPTVPGRFGFAHALVHQAVLGELTATRVAAVHFRVATALEGTGRASDAELAHHLLACGRQDVAQKATFHAWRAARAALDSLAPDLALKWATAAVDTASTLDDGVARGRSLVTLGEAQRQLGDPSFRMTLLEAAGVARRAGSPDLLIEAALANSRGVVSKTGAQDPERIELLESALEAVGPGDTAVRARLLSLLAVELAFSADHTRRQQVARDAADMARRLGDPEVLAQVLGRRLVAIWTPDTLPERLEETAEAETLCRRLGDPVGLFWTSINRALCAVEVADPGLVGSSLENVWQLAEQLRQPSLAWQAALTRTWWTLLRGDVAAAETHAHAAGALGSGTGQPDALLIYGGQLLAIRWHQGNLGDVVESVAGPMRAAGIAGLEASLAWILAEADREDESRELLATARAGGFRLPYDAIWLAAMSHWCDTATRLADHDAAAALYPVLLPWEDHVAHSGATVHGAIAHGLGGLAAVLGRMDAAERHFHRALAIHERLGAPFFTARTHLEWGRALREQSPRRAEAQGHLQRSAELAKAFECAGLQRRAEALL